MISRHSDSPGSLHRGGSHRRRRRISAHRLVSTFGYWTHHTNTALESTLESTILLVVRSTVTHSTDVDVNSNLSSSQSAPSTVLSVDVSGGSDRGTINAEPFTPKMNAMVPSAGGGETGGIFLGLHSASESSRCSPCRLGRRLGSHEHVTNMVKRYHRDRDPQVQEAV